MGRMKSDGGAVTLGSEPSISPTAGSLAGDQLGDEEKAEA